MAVHGLMRFEQIGFLADNPAFKQNGDGSKVANFRVVTNVSWKDKGTQEERGRAEGFNYELWGDSTDFFMERMKKGSQIYLEAEPRNEKYEKDGVTQWTVRFRVNNWRALDRLPKDDKPTGGHGADSSDKDIPF